MARVTEVDVPVRTFRVKALHDRMNCGGEFLFTGLVFPTNPPQYQHACTICCERLISHKKYPYIEYVETKEEFIED